MYDNKVRLSSDVLEKATLIASEWGLKNARAAVEAVFRRYADDYLHGSSRNQPSYAIAPPVGYTPSLSSGVINCEALDELDDLLGV
jgi:hypothetical protein